MDDIAAGAESEAYKAYKDDEGQVFWNERAEGGAA